MRQLVERCLQRFGFGVHRCRPDAFEVQKRLVTSPRPVIFDVGAHIGDAAASYRLRFPSAAISCFEPFPGAASQLESRFAGDPGIEVHRLALAASSGTSQMNVNSYVATNSLLPTDPGATRQWGLKHCETSSTITVETTGIDQFCKGHSIPRIHILKLDVQGGEYDVLKGASEMLTRQAIDLIYAEMIFAPTYQGQQPPGKYFQLMESFGYGLLDFYEPWRSGLRLMQADLLWLPLDTLNQTSSL
ncbi:2-O-methyltransferase NoeI [Caulifigura coniformis]|uniref:2-O-methyltransferase NoeI n=1 Tax=Caulifigura coniformis TaxID=2527983 RepID=A0A517SDN8_9PLAN|nr:FkbM family methyltransferase [Caulifigura coniformis]QDT54236.1 2-O-methyltransferase NoeI [Caulifigura coniformis]